MAVIRSVLKTCGVKKAGSRAAAGARVATLSPSTATNKLGRLVDRSSQPAAGGVITQQTHLGGFLPSAPPRLRRMLGPAGGTTCSRETTQAGFF